MSSTQSLPLRGLRRSEDDRVVAGVCSGIAKALGTDVTLVRLVFAVLALASGSGIVLYAAAWLVLPDENGRRGRAAEIAGALLLVTGTVLVVRGLGLEDSLLWPAALLGVGIALLSGTGPKLALRTPAGIVLIVAGILTFLAYSNPFDDRSAVPPGAIMAGLLLLVAPWVWRLARERAAERAERIRTQERAELAARVHDSVLQTLALIQRDAADSRRVATLARRQERELRSWLYREPGDREGETLVGAVEAAAAEIEELHGVRVEVVSAGDRPLDERTSALVLAAREAMANAAKFAGVEEISVYAEAEDGRASVFVRDRGVGFDRDAVPADRRGLSDSIEGRLARHGGTARVASAPGEGTEVELTVP